MRSIGISIFGELFVLAYGLMRTLIGIGGREVIVSKVVHKPNKLAQRLKRYC
jgi:hypothetical protein